MKSLGSKIKELREKKNCTQTELGKKVGVGKTTISNYETDYSTPDIETIGLIADFFNVSTDFLLGRTENPDEEISDTHYYINDDAREMAQEIFDNPDLKVLFDASRNLEVEDIKFVTDFVKKIKGGD